MPALVFLDLKLPRKSGFEVLEWLRQQPELATLPVVIYTSSDRPQDRERARELGANDFLVKEADVNKVARLVGDVLRRWLPAAAQSVH